MAREPRLERLAQGLARLRELDQDLQQFGALTHKYRLNPTLSEQALTAFEHEHRLTLPFEYRLFLAQVGNGGAGPYYGLMPLAAWQPELRLPHLIVEFDGDNPVMADGKPLIVDLGLRPEMDRLADPSHPFMLDGPWPRHDHDLLPAEGVHPLDGCTLLAEIGDGYHCFLVINGRRAGEVWEDHTHGAAYGALLPTGHTFLSWYEQWLDNAIRDCRDQDRS